jgi:CubicO group peptidase (beta-lactamase class C family)
MPLLLRVDAVRTMFTPTTTPETQYGMGWVIDRRGGRRYLWYGGGIAGYDAINALLPDDRIAVIVLANADSSRAEGQVGISGQVAGRILDVVAPPAAVQLDNAIVARAEEWLRRLARKQIDRTQLTPAFSSYLSDDFVARQNLAALGKLQAIVPISSTTDPNGDTEYVFLVRYATVQYHYKFAVTANGKIDELLLEN